MRYAALIRSLDKKGRLKRAVSAGLLAVGMSLPVASTALAQSGPITFQNVLDAPDDLQINLDYARQEVANGRLQQAASALERLLLNRPNWDSVRLFYGIVLYRLDDLEGSIRELRLLEGRGLPSDKERDRVKYLNLALQQSDSLRITGRFTAGGRLDSNPGRFANDDVFFFGAGDESDGAITGGAMIRIERDIDGRQGDYLFLQVDSHINEFFELDAADYLNATTRIGGAFFGPDRVIKPYFLYGGTFQQYQKYRTQVGGGVDTTWTLSEQVDFFVNGQAVYDNFSTTDFSFVGDLRDGWRSYAQAGIKWRPADYQTFEISGTYVRKNAQNDIFSYDEGKLRIKSTTLFGEGRYLALTGVYTVANFDDRSFGGFVFQGREDERYYARAAVGAPLQTLFSRIGVELPESIGDIVAQAGVSYRKQQSSFFGQNYHNVSGDIMFTKRVAF